MITRVNSYGTVSSQALTVFKFNDANDIENIIANTKINFTKIIFFIFFNIFI